MARRYFLPPLVCLLILSLAMPLGPATAAPESQPISQVRVVHTAPGLPPLELLIVGLRVPLPPLAFGLAAPYLNLPAGPHEFALVPAGAVPPIAAATSNISLAPGQPYTLMVLGVPPTVLVLEDTRFAAIGGPARIRFVHASPDAPPTVDLAVAGGATLFSGISHGQATPYIDIPAGTVTLEVRAVGSETVVLPLPDVALVLGTVYTFGAVGLVGGPPPLGALTLVDS